MEISDIRLTNLKTILEDDFGGIKAQLAKAAGVSPNNISRYFSDDPVNGRTIGDDTARLFERISKRPSGWMDQIHDGDEKLDKLRVLAEITSDFSDEELAELREQAALIRKRKSGAFSS